MSDFEPPGGPPPPPPPPDQPPGPGWWKASDGNWYPPEQAPHQPAQTPPPAGQPYGQHYPPSYAQYGVPQANGLATWALALGIASIVLFWTFGFGILLGIIGGVLFFGFLLTFVDDVREEIERQQDDGICDPDTIWDPDC